MMALIASSFQPTYEELKRNGVITIFNQYAFSAYLWGIETAKRYCDEGEVAGGFQPTYEELKPF